MLSEKFCKVLLSYKVLFCYEGTWKNPQPPNPTTIYVSNKIGHCFIPLLRWKKTQAIMVKTKNI